MAGDSPDRGGEVQRRGAVAEWTLRAVALGVVLSVVMCAANIYLGLKAGMTVSASIPAAVVSMAILRGLMRRGTLLENNLVQTIASTGESLAAGAIFTIPALVFVNVWDGFHYWTTTFVCMLGGLLGVVFMVPLRRAFIAKRTDLAFPEGVACSEILQAGQQGPTGAWPVFAGFAVAGLYRVAQAGFGLLQGGIHAAFAVGGRTFYAGLGLTPALVSVGYIVRLQIAAYVFLGGIISWGIALPLTTAAEPGANLLDVAMRAHASELRFLGVGAMLVAGLHSIWKVRHGIPQALFSVTHVPDDAAWQPEHRVPRTDRDIGLTALLIVFLIVLSGVVVLYDLLIENLYLGLLATAIMLPAAFIFVAVSTYIVGVVGSSNSPVSGMTICALLLAAAVFLGVGMRGESAVLATLGVAGVVCCAACTAGDIAQDLKTGMLVGATPRRQQWGEVIGAIVPAFVIAPVLAFLDDRYTIGSQELAAPQASLFAHLAGAFFGEGPLAQALPWDMIFAGMLAGAALAVTEGLLRTRGARFRVHVMPVAVGMYLPFTLGAAMFAGGLLRALVGRGGRNSGDRGVLFASGLIAGEALVSIAIAIPASLNGALPKWPPNALASVAAFGVVLALLAASARGGGNRD